MKKQKNTSYFMILTLFLFSSSAMASPETDFKQGFNSFQAEDYSAAIRLFESAKKQGMKSVALYYNLASSYYKMADYATAKIYFKRVTQSEKMKDLAEYNLGLIALRENNHNEANKYFTSIALSSKDTKLMGLAKKQLSNIRTTEKPWKVYLSANMGYDDNITASPSGTVLGLSDTFYDLFTSFDTVVAGKRKAGWIADASYFRIDFSDTNSSDEYQYAFGIRKEHRLGSWDSRLHFTLSQSNFGDTDYQTILKLNARGIKKISKEDRLYLSYRYEDIQSDSTIYDYLEGWRQRTRIEYRNFTSKHIKELYYELELNDRGYLVATTYAYDYSPTRHTVHGKYTYLQSNVWHWSGDLSYRMSDFPASASFDRDDDRLRFSLSANYRINKTLKLITKLRYTDNKSTVDQYDYNKVILKMGLSKVF